MLLATNVRRLIAYYAERQEELGICYSLFIQSFMTIVSQSRTEPFYSTRAGLYTFQTEYKRNYVCLALSISFIICKVLLSVRFRMHEWLFGPCS